MQAGPRVEGPRSLQRGPRLMILSWHLKMPGIEPGASACQVCAQSQGCTPFGAKDSGRWPQALVSAVLGWAGQRAPL